MNITITDVNRHMVTASAIPEVVQALSSWAVAYASSKNSEVIIVLNSKEGK